MQGGVFLMSAGDFPEGEDDSYLNLKCCKRMPQPMGGYAVSLGWITAYFLFFFFTKKDIRY